MTIATASLTSSTFFVVNIHYHHWEHLHHQSSLQCCCMHFLLAITIVVLTMHHKYHHHSLAYRQLQCIITHCTSRRRLWLMFPCLFSVYVYCLTSERPKRLNLLHLSASYYCAYYHLSFAMPSPSDRPQQLNIDICIIMQDEKNQIITTNCWLNQVGLIP